MFSLGEAELLQLKKRCAIATQSNMFGVVNGGKPFGLPVGGVPSFSEAAATAAWEKYWGLVDNPPGDETAKERRGGRQGVVQQRSVRMPPAGAEGHARGFCAHVGDVRSAIGARAVERPRQGRAPGAVCRCFCAARGPGTA